MLRALLLSALSTVPAGAQELVFSVDLGSDNGQDPGSSGLERGFDPGDVYNSTTPSSVPATSGAEGDVWDDCVLVGVPCVGPYPRPIPNPVDMASIWALGLCGSNTCFGQFFDLDGVQRFEADVPGILSGVLGGIALSAPLKVDSFPPAEAAALRASLAHVTSKGADDAVLYLSFDDDAALGWSGSVSGGPGSSIPGDSSTGLGLVHGGAGARDEVLSATIDVKVTSSGTTATTAGAIGIRSETEVHPDLLPNPSVSREWYDDDVDALGYGSAGPAPFLFFSSDHEATELFEWGDIYGTTPSVSKRISVTSNLGLPFGTDVDAFELVRIDHPSGFEALALLFSVDDDDAYTIPDESGGLSPGAIYLSYMDGSSSLFLDAVPYTYEWLYGIQAYYYLGLAPELFRIDPATGSETSLGLIAYDGGVVPDSINSLAADSSGTLYTMHDSKLVEIDPAAPGASTSVLDLVPPFTSGTFAGTSGGMVFDDAGTLWFLSWDGADLYSLSSLGSGAYVYHGTVATPSLGLMGLAYDASTGLLVAADNLSDLYTIDLSSGAPVVTAYPNPSVLTETYGLAYSGDGRLFGSEDTLQRFSFSGSGSSHVDVGPVSSGVDHMHGLAFASVSIVADDVDALAVAPSSSSLAVSYCTPGTSASGCQATLVASGAASGSATHGFTLTALGTEGGKDGMIFFGTSGRQAQPWGNGSSYQCVRPPVLRGGVLEGSGAGGSCGGVLAQDLNALWAAKPAMSPGAGVVVQAQCWYRDPLSTSNQQTSLSDAVEFPVGL